MNDLVGHTLAWGRVDGDFVVAADWSDHYEVAARDGTTIVGRGWDLHPRIRWEVGGDWAVADAVWGVPKGSEVLRRADFQPGQVLALNVGQPSDSGLVSVWNANRSKQVGFVPEPYATDLKDRLTRNLPVCCVCTWLWCDVSGIPRTIRCLYATAPPEFLVP